MTRHVPAPASGPVRIAELLPAVAPVPVSRSVRRRTARRPVSGQPSLFPLGVREVS